MEGKTEMLDGLFFFSVVTRKQQCPGSFVKCHRLVLCRRFLNSGHSMAWLLLYTSSSQGSCADSLNKGKSKFLKGHPFGRWKDLRAAHQETPALSRNKVCFWICLTCHGAIFKYLIANAVCLRLLKCKGGCYVTRICMV